MGRVTLARILDINRLVQDISIKVIENSLYVKMSSLTFSLISPQFVLY